MAFPLACYFPFMTRSGIVAVVGKPNAGKSTLLNRLVGQKLAITSPKPQSTRNRVVGILTDQEAQIVLLDTPGLLNPRYALQESMQEAAVQALRDADVVLYLVDVNDIPYVSLQEAAELEVVPTAPVITVINKVDLLNARRRAELGEQHPDAVLLSSTQGDGVADLLARVRGMLPESPYLYPEDELSTQTLRFFAGEMIRETALEQLGEEVPYSVACEIEEFREERRPVYIRAVVYVERESQRRILIGSGGTRIREIGKAARIKLEAIVDAPVYLDLWVKVLENWRKNRSALERFGYRLPKGRK